MNELQYCPQLETHEMKREERERNYDFWLDSHLPDGEELGLRLVLCEQRGLLCFSLKTTVCTRTEICGDLDCSSEYMSQLFL